MTRVRRILAAVLVVWAVWALVLIVNGTDEVRW